MTSYSQERSNSGEAVSFSSAALRTEREAQTIEPRQPQTMTNRRRHDRILGPFEGIRVGALDTPVRIYDFSPGGCFVNAMHDQPSGSRLVLRIDLPDVDVITVTAEALDGRRDCGFPVRFVDIADETAIRIDQAFQHLQSVALRSEHQRLHEAAALILPLSAAVWESHAEMRTAPSETPSQKPRRSHRPRGSRVSMIGTAYRALIDGQRAALIDLSLSGAQVRAALELRPGQPIMIKIGWLHEERCAALGRVRWVRLDPGHPGGAYRAGLAFETSDVRELKEIVSRVGHVTAHRSAR
jgi:PilZ domain-containing protein